MIDKCRQYRNETIDWRCADIQQTSVTNASLVVLNLTLQFLQPSERAPLLQQIFAGMNQGGALVLTEKVIFDDKRENERMVELYQAFKKSMGYSELEISQKRNALENVLVPDSESEHLQRLHDVGFDEVYRCFRGFNFVSFVAIKA